MKAIRCHQYAAFGDDGRQLAAPRPIREVLSLDEVPPVGCGDHDLRIAVSYAGVQYPDFLQARGLYQVRPPLPYVPGIDAAGTVVEVGGQVEGVAVGDRVVAQLPIGAMAEFVRVPAARVWPVPDAIDLSRLANLGRNYFPAYHALKTVGQAAPGQLVLVDGASGGVGMAAVELAKALGATVIAGVSTTDKAAPPRSVGADRVLCYGRDRESYRRFRDEVRAASAELDHPDGVDLVVDVVQGDLFEPGCLSTIRPLGRIAMVGFTGGQTPIRPGMLLIKQAQAIGSLWGPWAEAHPTANQRNGRDILALMAAGTVTPRVDRVFPLADFVGAFELFENNRGRGNTVVAFAGS